MNKSEIEIRPLCSTDFDIFRDFLERIDNKPNQDFFNPHPFTNEEAKRLCEYQGKDEYYIVTEGQEMIGYGMLRGWDEGYEIPSLGLFILNDFRSMGLGSLMMNFLHFIAKLRNATSIRIKVHKHNYIAKGLYDKYGYEFSENIGNYLIGYCEV